MLNLTFCHRAVIFELRFDKKSQFIFFLQYQCLSRLKLKFSDRRFDNCLVKNWNPFFKG